MTRSADFSRTIRFGLRVGKPTLVLHANRDLSDRVLVGLVVSRGVGNAVTRNRVKRRLRHLAAKQISSTPAGTDLVVRALPRAVTAPAELASDLPSAWSTAVDRLTTRSMP